MHIPHRHGCLTAWLYLIIVGGTFGMIGVLLASKYADRPGHPLPSPLLTGLIVACLLADIACASLLFWLKRWAFYGYILANVVLCGANFAAGFNPTRALVPLIWIACLIGVMQIGGRARAWKRLR